MPGDEATLIVRIQEGGGGPTQAGATRGAGQPAARERAPRESTSAGGSELHGLLRTVLGGGISLALSNLVAAISSFFRGPGTAAASAAQSNRLTPPPQRITLPRTLNVSRLTVNSPRTGIMTQQMLVQAQQVSIQAASVRISGMPRQPGAPKAPTPPPTPPAGGRGRGSGKGGKPPRRGFTWLNNVEPRYPPPAPIIPKCYPPPGQAGIPIFPQKIPPPRRRRRKIHVSAVPYVMPGNVPPTKPPKPPAGRSAAGGAGAARSAISTLASLGEVGALVGAVIAVTVGLGHALASAIDSASKFSLALTSASTDISEPLTALGASVRSTGAELTKWGNGMGIILEGVGAAAENFGRLLNNLNQMADRYASVNPNIAVAEAQAEVAMLLGDIRRGQQAAPELTRYIQARTEIQQKYEDMKIAYMERLLPLVNTVLEYISEHMPNKEQVEGTLNNLELGSQLMGGNLLGAWNTLQRWREEWNANKDESQSPADLIMNNPNPLTLFRGNVPDPNKPPPGV